MVGIVDFLQTGHNSLNAVGQVALVVGLEEMAGKLPVQHGRVVHNKVVPGRRIGGREGG